MKHVILCLLLQGLAATAAHAEDKFALMDTTKDGSVTWEEFQASYPNMQKAAFTSIDVDKSGTLSRDEWEMFMARHQMGKMPKDGMPEAPGHTPTPLITPPPARQNP